jgi:hypothetical protein
VEPFRLLPGDVLLTPGTDWIAQAIQLFDDSPVSHAAILASDSQVLEATPEGIDCRPFAAAPRSPRQAIVRRWDPARSTGTPLLSSAWEQAAVGDRFFYDPILLLAMVLLARQTAPTRHLAPLVRTILELAASTLSKALRGHGKRPLLSPWIIDIPYSNAGLAEQPRASSHGAGLNPAGLLARMLRSPRRGKARPASARAAGSTRPSTALAALANAREAEARFQRYVRSLGSGSQREGAGSFRVESFIPSITRLASTLYSAILLSQDLVDIGGRRWLQARASLGDGDAPNSGEDEPGAQLCVSQLRRLAARLITPGDLLRSKRFVTIGTIAIL